MKKSILLLLLSVFLFTSRSEAQKSYGSAGGELIVGFADFDSAGKAIYGRPRLSLFFHLNLLRNTDFGNNFGIAYGFAARNIGFTRLDEYLPSNEDPTNVPFYEKVKRRSWTLGVPFMFKLGNFKKNRFLLFGAEYSLLFHFKEKRWLNGDKRTRKTWFSEETARFLPSAFVGFQVNERYMIKFQYYWEDFLNKDFTVSSSQGDFQPYANYNSKLFYVSLQSNIRLDKRKLKKPTKKKDGDAQAFKLGFR